VKKPLVAPIPVPVPRAAPPLAATQRRRHRVARLLAVVDRRVARLLAVVGRRVARQLAAVLRRVAIGVRVVVPTSIAARDPSVAIGMIVRRARP